MNFVLFAVPSFANNPVSGARQKTVIKTQTISDAKTFFIEGDAGDNQ